MCCSTTLSSVQRLLIGLNESMSVVSLPGLLMGVMRECLNVLGKVFVHMIVLMRCVM